MSKIDLTLANARLKILETQKEKPKKTKAENGKAPKHTQEYLWKAIEAASKVWERYPEEEKRIHSLIKKIEDTKEEDPNWETRIAYHEHNLWVMRETYPMLQDEAKRRKDLIDSTNRTGRWGAEKEKCTHDSRYWFDNYAWTADPRKSGIWALPFMLYDFQYEAVDWFEDLIFLEQSSGLVDKSRDLGLSWLLTSLFYKHWQHPRDGAFNALMGSISSGECDTIGDPSSMFEKLRIQARLQPLGLLPKGWDVQIPYMRCVNPENGSTITGETANADFGRSGRYKVILFDEFSAFEQDTGAMTASSQSSPCKIYNSTARGMGNEFARLRHSGNVKVKTFHWKLHPYKTDAWYNYQKLEMNPVQVAQELDIDYNASQPNKVYGDYNEVYQVVTQSEIIGALPSFGDSMGRFRIPFGHSISMGYDVGQSDEHANALLWFVTLKEGTKTAQYQDREGKTHGGVDVGGMVLCYRELMPDPHTTPRTLASLIKKHEGLYEHRMVYDRVMSHEQTTVRDALDWDYGIAFRKWTSDYNDGIARVRDYLQITKKHLPHPFREPSRQQLFPEAPPIMGRPNLVMVVADGQGELKYEPSLQRYGCTPAKDHDGMVRLRAEFPAYHFATSELGKELKKMRPVKKFDDFMDVVRCVATECFAPMKPLTEEEKFQKGLPENLQPASIEQMSPQERGMAVLQTQHLRREYHQQLQRTGQSYRDQLFDKLKHGTR